MVPEDPQSPLFRYWRVIVAFGVVAVVAVVAWRAFLDYRANSPVVEPYLTLINEMSSQSPRVRRRLEQY